VVKIEEFAKKLGKEDLIVLASRIQQCNNLRELEHILLLFSAETGVSLYNLFGQQIEDLLITKKGRSYDRHFFLIIRSRILKVLSSLLAYLYKERVAFDKSLIDKEFDVRKTGAGAKP